jgi:NADPH:quinone reductase-like Zn-dependent oxidoreductase
MHQSWQVFPEYFDCVKRSKTRIDLRRNGVYVTVGGSISRLLQALFLGPWIYMTSKKHIRIVALKKNKDLVYMNELFEAGKVKPVIDRPYQLNEVPEAFRIFAKGEHKGKLVVTM